MDTLKIVCDNCKQEIGPLQTQKRVMKRGFFEVGFCCPLCSFWVHSHYTTPKLDLAERILSNFKQRSEKLPQYRWQYERKIQEFLGQHQRVQEDAKKVVKSGIA